MDREMYRSGMSGVKTLYLNQLRPLVQEAFQ